MSLMKEKQQEFLDALNDKLPKNIIAKYVPSQTMKNVLNVVISHGSVPIQVLGLSEDTDKNTGEHSVWWFNNYTGRFY